MFWRWLNLNIDYSFCLMRLIKLVFGIFDTFCDTLEAILFRVKGERLLCFHFYFLTVEKISITDKINKIINTYIHTQNN